MDRNRGLIACLPALSLLYLLVFPLPVDLPSGIAMVSFASADTVPGGNVSGTWYESNSPYYIAGNITIQAGDTLTIEPGVEAIFLAYFSMTANGVLEAVGTETDSIHFFPENTLEGWSGIICDDGMAGLHNLISYCGISHADCGIYELGGTGKATISHSCFRNNMQAIYWYPDGNATLQITDCEFRENSGVEEGAAIRILAADFGIPTEIKQ